jgi:hypothetical protein
MRLQCAPGWQVRSRDRVVGQYLHQLAGLYFPDPLREQDDRDGTAAAQRSNSQYLWIKISGGFGLVLLAGPLDVVAVDEGRSGADQGDEVGRVHGAPAVLGRLDELERHGQPGRT